MGCKLSCCKVYSDQIRGQTNLILVLICRMKVLVMLVSLVGLVVGSHHELGHGRCRIVPTGTTTCSSWTGTSCSDSTSLLVRSFLCLFPRTLLGVRQMARLGFFQATIFPTTLYHGARIRTHVSRLWPLKVMSLLMVGLPIPIKTIVS